MAARPEDVIRVLIADDHSMVRQGLRTFLELQDGIEVVGEAADGAECAERAAELDPDVILLDIGLWEMDGCKVATQRRARAAGKQPLIVAVTGYSEEADRWRSADSGVDMHWVKPADPESLARMLDWVRGLLTPAARTE